MSPGPVSGLITRATVLMLACLVSAACGTGGGGTVGDMTDNGAPAVAGTAGATSVSPNSVASTAPDQGGPGDQFGSVASGSTSTEPVTAPTASTTIATASTAPAPSPPPARSPSAGQGDPMITFGIEGGFAAQLRSLQISPDGDLVTDISGRRSTGHLSPVQVAAIVAALDASGLFDADHTYSPPPNGADLQRYEITYRGATVVAHDTTVPRALTGAVRLLTAALGAVT